MAETEQVTEITAPISTTGTAKTRAKTTSKRGRIGEGRPRTRPTAAEAAAAMSPAEIDAMDGDFFDIIKMYNPEEWRIGAIFMYCYRLRPKIDRDKTGNYHNIQKFSCPVDPDEIMRASYGGSGEYQLLLNRFIPQTRATVKLRSHVFRIFNMDWPPRIPAGEWLDEEINREWQWCKPILEAQQKAAAATAAAAGSNAAVLSAGNGNDMLNTVLTVMDRFGLRPNENGADKELAAEVIKTLREQHAESRNSGGNPAEMITAIVGAITTITGLAAPQKDSGELNRLTEDLRAERKAYNELMLKMLDAKNEPRGGIVEQLKELAGVKDVVGSLFGRGPRTVENPAAAGINWAEVGLKTFDKLMTQAPLLLHAFGLGRAGIRQPPPAAVQQSQQLNSPTATQAAPIPDAEKLPPLSQEEHAEMIRGIANQFGPMFDEVTPMLVQYFTRGASGMEFRDWFIEEYGRRTLDFMKQMAPETIVEVIETRKTEAAEGIRSQLARLAPTEKLLEFVKEFQSDTEVPDEDDDEEDTLPVATAPPQAAAARAPKGF